jgi:hypothetical protein
MVVGSVGGSVGVARGQWTDLGWSWCGGAVLMASSQLSWSYGRDGQDLWDQPCLDLPVIPRRQWLTKSPQRRDRVAGSRAGCLTSCMPLTSQPLAPHHSSTRSHISPAQHADSIEATGCRMRHREGWLLADCWQFGARTVSASSSRLASAPLHGGLRPRLGGAPQGRPPVQPGSTEALRTSMESLQASRPSEAGWSFTYRVLGVGLIAQVR